MTPSAQKYKTYPIIGRLIFPINKKKQALPIDTPQEKELSLVSPSIPTPSTSSPIPMTSKSEDIGRDFMEEIFGEVEPISTPDKD